MDELAFRRLGRKGLRVVRNPKGDPQRENLYAAELSFCPDQQYERGLSATTAREVIKHVCRLYRVPIVPLTFVKDGGWWAALMEVEYRDGVAVRGRLIVNTEKDRLTLHSLLHELAHWIDKRYFGMTEGHGRSFVGIASFLYNRYKVIPVDAYQLICRRHGVKFMPMEECSPAALIQMSRRKAKTKPR